MARPVRVAIDVRPLARGPATGIGLLLTQIIESLTPHGFQFIGLSDRPVQSLPFLETVEVRAAGGAGRIRWESVQLPGILRGLDPPPDLFHATWNHGVPDSLPFPSVLSLHDLIPWVIPRAVPWPRPAALHRWLYRRAVRASARRAAAVVTLSEASRRDIAARLPESAGKTTVVPCAVPRWYVRASRERVEAWRARFGGAPYWLYFGGFDPRKGVDLLIEALARAFPDRRSMPVVVLAGSPNEERERIARIASESEITGHFPGYVPDPELSALVEGAQLFVYPSRYEGFGIPPLLAMAVGTPCLTSDAASLPEVVGDAALLFHAGDVSALAGRLREIADRPGMLEPLRSSGPRRAARFTEEALAGKMIQVYESAASLPRGSG